jgi:hypothetical protein
MPDEELQFPFDEDFVDPLHLIVAIEKRKSKERRRALFCWCGQCKAPAKSEAS